jgi:general secretion pathway protein A
MLEEDMYTEFYGLKELPFALTPDPRYIYFTPSHTEVMANLHYGIESGKGLIVVTGEVGTGKTTMLRWVMSRLDRTVMVAYIFNPRLSVTEFYQHLATLSTFRIGNQNRISCSNSARCSSRVTPAACALC